MYRLQAWTRPAPEESRARTTPPALQPTAVPPRPTPLRRLSWPLQWRARVLEPARRPTALPAAPRQGPSARLQHMPTAASGRPHRRSPAAEELSPTVCTFAGVRPGWRLGPRRRLW